jgi:hypothetical protein
MTMLLKGRRSWQHFSFAHLGPSAVASGPKGQFPPGMANSPGIVRFVTEFTVLTRQLPQYDADGSGEKDPAVPPGNSHGTCGWSRSGFPMMSKHRLLNIK